MCYEALSPVSPTNAARQMDISDLVIVLNVNSTNSKQSKLCVKCTLYIDTRLFWKHAVRRNRPQYVYDEIVKASVSGMLHLRNVFQFVVYRLYNNVSSTKTCRDAFLRLGKQDCRIKSPVAKTWQLAETQECVSTVW